MLRLLKMHIIDANIKKLSIKCIYISIRLGFHNKIIKNKNCAFMTKNSKTLKTMQVIPLAEKESL